MNESREGESLDQLWAPWRLGYATSKPAEGGCFICRGVADSNDRANLVAGRTDSAVVILNRHPYNNGHVLVCPRSHKAGLHELTDAETLDLQRTIVRTIEALKRAINADGFNVGLNLGRVAGAGVPGHLHWHVVPRWHGDTNFMPVVADTKVIVQSLDSLYDLLVREL